MPPTRAPRDQREPTNARRYANSSTSSVNGPLFRSADTYIISIPIGPSTSASTRLVVEQSEEEKLLKNLQDEIRIGLLNEVKGEFS